MACGSSFCLGMGKVRIFFGSESENRVETLRLELCFLYEQVVG